MKNNHLIATRSITQKTFDHHPIQTAQVEIFSGHQEPEIHEEMPRIQDYGFTSHPVSGEVDSIILSLGGDRTNSVVIATEDRRHRKKNLKEGEVALYDNQGQCLYLKREGKAELNINDELTIHVGQAKLILKQDGSVTINGNLQVQGSITSTEDVTAGNISLTKHIHPGIGKPPTPAGL